ncbi:transcriptional modulator of MazE/toxin, MazF [Stanieria cyanosphaera PCC 7437]|uniref:mRNA interferase n=1 Tax=Stanieria cyanosphaera (strain ATCC 29371 / PCC 7437) TaxID=111780 RepID=K9XZL1_STAC7|nr:type II toxin-antitoxin system PemK/MazF family toxin [Stanieria cyanosphaera]AFZ37484.1 transcriptional modulator of MazE/toxin, MazF [Stanieria cyanosphaera PCC 7437]
MDGRILRREIYWANLNPIRGREQGGNQPVLIISNNIFNQRSGTTVILAITSVKLRVKYPLILELDCSSLPKQSWVKITQIRTISNERIGDYIGQIDIAQMKEIILAIDDLIGED